MGASDRGKTVRAPIRRTERALIDAFGDLLRARKFAQITVHALCGEAEVSRATFYAHFTDKYDLLRRWLQILRNQIIKDVYDYDGLAENVNRYISEHQREIFNVLRDADSEVLDLVYEFMCNVISLAIKRTMRDQSSKSYSTIVNFCAGGLTHLLLGQMRANKLSDFKMVNPYLYKMLEHLTIWDAEQERLGQLSAE